MIVPSYKTVDMKTEVEVSSDDTSIPLDTTVTVKAVKNDNIKKAVGTDAYKAYDISLYSSAKKEQIKKLDNGNFEVSIPVPENLKGKDNLVIYYVTDKGIEGEYTADLSKKGYAVFETNHFSTYVLAEEGTVKKDVTPATGNIFNILNIVTITTVLSFAGLVVLKRKKAKI